MFLQMIWCYICTWNCKSLDVMHVPQYCRISHRIYFICGKIFETRVKLTKQQFSSSIAWWCGSNSIMFVLFLSGSHLLGTFSFACFWRSLQMRNILPKHTHTQRKKKDNQTKVYKFQTFVKTYTELGVAGQNLVLKQRLIMLCILVFHWDLR